MAAQVAESRKLKLREKLKLPVEKPTFTKRRKGTPGNFSSETGQENVMHTGWNILPEYVAKEKKEEREREKRSAFIFQLSNADQTSFAV